MNICKSIGVRMQARRTLGHGEDGTLLNGKGLLETICVDAAEELVLEVEIIEALDNGVPVGLRIACAAVSSLHGRDADRHVRPQWRPQGPWGWPWCCRHARGVRWVRCRDQRAGRADMACVAQHSTAQQPRHNASRTTRTDEQSAGFQ